MAAHGSRAVTPIWPLCLAAPSGGGQRTDEIARVGGGSLECLVGRLGSECGSFNADDLDVGHAEEAERVFEPGNLEIECRVFAGVMAAHVASGDERGCPLANAAVEPPEKDHPARRVIEAFKTAQRERLVQLCTAAALAEPDMLAGELFLLLEGARVAAQSMGPLGLGDRLVRMGEAMINAHTIIEPAHQSAR